NGSSIGSMRRCGWPMKSPGSRRRRSEPRNSPGATDGPHHPRRSPGASIMARLRKLTMAERGRLGGRATVARHGAAHMAAIGKLGFQGLARSLGYKGGSRLGALQFLIGKGKIKLSARQRAAEASAVAWADEFMARFFETCK